MTNLLTQLPRTLYLVTNGMPENDWTSYLGRVYLKREEALANAGGPRMVVKLRLADEPKAGILENKLSQDQMQALFTGPGAPGREHHDPTCIKFFGVFSPLPCPCKRPAERTGESL